MKIYQVGGSVRDQLMGIRPRDFDYVITGSTHEELLKLGYQDVGKGHKVYLHPENKEEYTLSVDLYSDLARRDLTINALALDDGKVIDYFGGLEDLKEHCLRHIKTQNFFTDPLRVYRVARFKAQFPTFHIHPETLELMREIKDLKEFKNLDPERIFGELKKALLAPAPAEFFLTLADVDALSVHMNEMRDHDFSQIEEICSRSSDPVLRFAGLFISLPSNDVKEFSGRLRVPNDWRDAALVVSEVNRWQDYKNATSVLELFYKIDAFRKPVNISIVTEVFPEFKENLEKAYHMIRDVSVKDIAPGLSGQEIAAAIRDKRLMILNQHQDKVL